MIIVISGQDTFRSRQFLHETIESFKKKRDPQGLNVHFFDAKENNIYELKRLEGAGGLFGGRRLFVVENFSQTASHPEEISTYLSERNAQNGNVLCFFIVGDLPASGIGKLLKNAKYHYHFSLLGGKELTSWIKGRFAFYHAAIEKRALETFVALCGNNLWSVDREIAKLSSYAFPQAVSVSDITALSSFSQSYSVFELVEAFLRRDEGGVMRGINNLPEEDYPGMLALLAGQFRVLGWLKEYQKQKHSTTEAASLLGVHPFVVKKLSSYQSKVTFLEIGSLIQRLVRAEYQIKSTPIDRGALVSWALGH